MGAPELTLTYSGTGSSRHVYAQLVDDTTGLVLGNAVTPVPVTLDGQTHTVSALAGARGADAAPRADGDPAAGRLGRALRTGHSVAGCAECVGHAARAPDRRRRGHIVFVRGAAHGGGVGEELADHDAFTAALDEFWPILTPETLLAELYTSPERLRAAGADPALWRADGEAWTVSDVPLLDELVDLLGRDKPADQTAERERRAEEAYAAGVLDNMLSREDLMDDEDHLLAQDMLDAEDLAERFLERDTRELAERAAADRDWTYGHIVVDEAQELSEMDWRVLMRRCPSRSFTVVGDLSQRRSMAGATSWATMLEPYVPGRWVYRSLSVNYRTPAEIMTVAAALLAEFAPGCSRRSRFAHAASSRGHDWSLRANYLLP